MTQVRKDFITNTITPVPLAKANPIDATPHAEGNLIVDDARTRYRFATGNEREMGKYHGKRLYISHFQTCPNAARHKKKNDDERGDR